MAACYSIPVEQQRSRARTFPIFVVTFRRAALRVVAAVDHRNADASKFQFFPTGTLIPANLNRFLVAGSCVGAFQRRKPAVIGAKAPYPGFIEPALASSIERVPPGQRWIHEIKFDGYRVQVHLVNEAVKVLTRHDWTRRLRKIADDAWHVSAG